MKSKTFYRLLFLVIIICLAGTSSCTKDPPVIKYKRENPFSEYLFQNNSVTIIPHLNNESLEIGYVFTSLQTGIIDELGIRLPDVGEVYTVSLWDGATRELLIQKNIKVNTSGGFNYDDLVSTGESKVIYANHPYMVGVFLVPVGKSELSSSNFYNVRRNDGENTGNLHVVSFLKEFSLITTTPAFPNNASQDGNTAGGLIDIGVRYLGL